MISRMLGAPCGGTTRAGQYGFDWSACRPISPPNFGGGGGRYFPSIVVVAPGEPGVPVVCCAAAGTNVSMADVSAVSASAVGFIDCTPECCARHIGWSAADALCTFGNLCQRIPLQRRRNEGGVARSREGLLVALSGHARGW